MVSRQKKKQPTSILREGSELVKQTGAPVALVFVFFLVASSLVPVGQPDTGHQRQGMALLGVVPFLIGGIAGAISRERANEPSNPLKETTSWMVY